MNRKLKVLGLSFMAVLLFGVITASGASAKGWFTAAKYPVVITAVNEGVPAPAFTTTAGKVECKDALFEGTATKTTTAITFKPTFNVNDTCVTAGSIPSVVHANQCDFNLTIDPTSATTAGWIDLECAKAGEDITVTVNKTTTGSETLKCTVHVPPQTVGGVTYSNVGGKQITVNIDATGITYTHTSGSGLGACVGTGATEQHNGTFKGKLIATGYEDTDVAGGYNHSATEIAIDIGA